MHADVHCVDSCFTAGNNAFDDSFPPGAVILARVGMFFHQESPAFISVEHGTHFFTMT